MGYTTEFTGHFTISPPMEQHHLEYLNAFAATRRMRRSETAVHKLPDQKRITVGLPIGLDGCYYVGGDDRDWDGAGIVEYNSPPRGQPGLWCQWCVSADGTRLQWDGGEKFYNYKEWLQYLMEHFITPWGYQLSGEVTWQGEEEDDRGTLTVPVGAPWLPQPVCSSEEEPKKSKPKVKSEKTIKEPTRQCPCCKKRLIPIGTIGILDNDSRWDAETARYLCKACDLMIFLTEASPLLEAEQEAADQEC